MSSIESIESLKNGTKIACFIESTPFKKKKIIRS